MPGRKILVIDDEPDIVSFLTTLLQDHGYETCSAKDGEEGWKKVCGEHPDLICLDLLMPQKSGVKLYGQIRKDPASGTHSRDYDHGFRPSGISGH